MYQSGEVNLVFDVHDSGGQRAALEAFRRDTWKCSGYRKQPGLKDCECFVSGRAPGLKPTPDKKIIKKPKRNACGGKATAHGGD
jgi:hypothetical protein